MESKIILITGASKGIGAAIYDYLREHGHKVYGTSRNGNPPEKLNGLLALDVTDINSIEAVVKAIIAKEGKIDVLINNAGFAFCGAVLSTKIEQMQQQFDTNLFGIHRMIRAVAPDMVARKNGLIINIGSFGGRLAIPYETMYSASKAGVAMYTDGLRMELKRSGVQVTLIEPGDVKTGIADNKLFTDDFQSDSVAQTAIDIMNDSVSKGSDPIQLAKLVNKLLKKKTVKPRYVFGGSTKLLAVVQRFLSYTLQEKLIMSTYGVKSK